MFLSPVITRILLGYPESAVFDFAGRPKPLMRSSQFVAGLTQRDLAAAKHRLHLVAQNDPLRPGGQSFRAALRAERSVRIRWYPGFGCAGGLRGNCPGLKGYRIIWLADHNVLGTSPDVAAEADPDMDGLGAKGRKPGPESKSNPKIKLQENMRERLVQ